MRKSDLYLHYKSLVKDACLLSEFDRIIESAFNDYMKDNLTDVEYSRIYFACVARQNVL